MRILLPVAGETPYFPPEDYPFPKPLIEVGGIPMIERAVQNLSGLAPDARFIFVAMHDEATRFSYESIFRLVTDGKSDSVLMQARTAGALCSCLMAIDQIDPDEPLIIANYDQVVDIDMAALAEQFAESGAAAGVLTFPATHPRWSYVLMEGNRVLEASEKRVISRNAIAGFYWFRTGATFIEAAKATIMADDSVEGVFYIAHCLNHIILAGQEVVGVPTLASTVHSFYLPTQIEAFERELENHAQRQPLGGPVNIVIPAAGEGSRFAQAGYTAPKPFIDVLGKPMIAHVQSNVEVRDSQFTVLIRSRDMGAANDLFEHRDDTHIEAVDALTEGTVCTVLLARHRIDNDSALLIANSDQLVDFSVQDFLDDARRRDLDGSILVFRDPTMNPKWSFARVDETGLVREVAEKKPISDLATVGIYLFSNGSDFVGAAIDMIVRNDRVNGEFYTCPVYNYLIRQGARIGVYEVDATAMHGLGLPEDLDAFLEKKGGPGRRSRHAPEPLRASHADR